MARMTIHKYPDRSSSIVNSISATHEMSLHCAPGRIICANGTEIGRVLSSEISAEARGLIQDGQAPFVHPRALKPSPSLTGHGPYGSVSGDVSLLVR